MNFKIKPLIPSLFISFNLAIIFMGCVTNESAGPTTPEGDPGFYASYTILGSNLKFPAQSKTYNECSSQNELISKVTTIKEDSMNFNIHGDTLDLGMNHPESRPSGAIVQLVTLFLRKGSGSGLDGQWVRIGSKYLLNGTFSPEEMAYYNKSEIDISLDHAGNTFVLDFQNGLMKSYLDTQTAERFLGNWNNGFTGPFEDTVPPVMDISIYDITVKVLEKHKVQLKGSITGETVTISHPDQDGAIYSSSNSSHLEFTFSRIPKSCPAEFEPSWYKEFIYANKKMDSKS